MKIKLLFPVLLVLAFSCEQGIEINNENIQGVWKAAEFQSEIPEMTKEYKEAGEKEFLSSVYTLNDNFSMEMTSDYYVDGATGHWEFDPKTNEISMIYNYDTIQGMEKYIIQSLSQKELVLRQDININQYKGFVQLTLRR